MTLGRCLAAGSLAATLVLGACGGEGTSRFADEVGAIEHAVEAGNRDQARSALEALQADIRSARAEGDIDERELQELEALLYESSVLVDTVLPPPTTDPPEPSEPPEDHDEDRGKEDEDGDDEREDDDDKNGEKKKDDD